MPYGTPPTVAEVIADHKAGTTDYTVGWKGMLDILVAEVELLTKRADRAKQFIEYVAPQSAVGALNGDYDADL